MIIRSEELDAREEALIAVTREAGELARDFFSKPIEVKLKGKQDYITEADGQVERMIVARLKARFPDDAFLGEEGGASGTAGGPLWVIDPIDGTANFAHGIPHFCVSIAFMAGAELALGAIAAPMYGELYRARLGRGAFLNDRAMRVADADIKQAVVELGWSSRRPVRAYTAIRPESIVLKQENSSGLRGTIRKSAYLGTHMEYTVESPIGSLFVVDREVSRPMPAGTEVSITLANHGVALVPG